jgi:hypothetical protein
MTQQYYSNLQGLVHNMLWGTSIRSIAWGIRGFLALIVEVEIDINMAYAGNFLSGKPLGPFVSGIFKETSRNESEYA